MPFEGVHGKPVGAARVQARARRAAHHLERDLREILDLAAEIGPAVRRGEGGFAAVAARQIAAAAGGALRLIGAEQGADP